jgi:hypothetical protein
MLKERRNLLGRVLDGGPAGLRIAARGEPLARETALELRLKGLGFEAKMEPLEPGRRSWGGEAAKHSSKDIVEALGKLSTPAPNLNAGTGLLFSCCLKDTVLVE